MGVDGAQGEESGERWERGEGDGGKTNGGYADAWATRVVDGIFEITGERSSKLFRGTDVEFGLTIKTAKYTSWWVTYQARWELGNIGRTGAKRAVVFKTRAWMDSQKCRRTRRPKGHCRDASGQHFEVSYRADIKRQRSWASEMCLGIGRAC